MFCINAINVFVIYSSQLNLYNVAKMNALLEVECKGNVILEFLLSNVQRLSYVYQLTLCIFNNFDMKNKFYIDSMDLLHKKKTPWIY